MFLLKVILVFSSILLIESEQTLICPKPLLKNGTVRTRNKKRELAYSCNEGFELIGYIKGSCIQGQWDHVPVCTKPGCEELKAPPNAIVEYGNKNTTARLVCPSEFKLAGPFKTHCDGEKWDRPLGNCRTKNTKPATRCDFETSDLCGWKNDIKNNVNWERKDGTVSYTELETGPLNDHTTGKPLSGYFLVVDSFKSRKYDVGRLISPTYPAKMSTKSCFSFWYHLHGEDVGAIRVYVKPTSTSWDAENKLTYEQFQYGRNQGNVWKKQHIDIPYMGGQFQIILEATLGGVGKSNIAIDDLKLAKGDDCKVEIVAPEKRIIHSCQSKCSISVTNVWKNNSNLAHCECHMGCVAAGSCCSDYDDWCIPKNKVENVLEISNHTILKPIELDVKIISMLGQGNFTEQAEKYNLVSLRGYQLQQQNSTHDTFIIRVQKYQKNIGVIDAAKNATESKADEDYILN